MGTIANKIAVTVYVVLYIGFEIYTNILGFKYFLLPDLHPDTILGLYSEILFGGYRCLILDGDAFLKGGCYGEL